MLRHLDKVIIIVAAAAMLTLIAVEIVGLAQGKRARADYIVQARKLSSDVDGNDFDPLPRNAKDYSSRVFQAWEYSPYVDSLSRWDFYPRSRP